MGNRRSLNREPSRARSCSLWCQTSHSPVTDCRHTWSENGHPFAARALWSWDLATPESERASSRLDLASSESCLLRNNAHFRDNSCPFGNPFDAVFDPSCTRGLRGHELLFLACCSRMPGNLLPPCLPSLSPLLQAQNIVSQNGFP
jgi:hypothetical protein